MKISRKVARRSHSSISRRRLRSKKSRSGYRKRHAKTHKGGARSRKYGHKRGKRFHRGGEGEFQCPTTWTLDGQSKLSKTIKLGISQAEVPNVTLFFKKKGSFAINPVGDKFTITLGVCNSPVYQREILPYTPPVFEVLLKRRSKSRDDNRSVSFYITHLGDFTDKEALKQLVRLESDDETYDFSSSKNDITFKSIQECVRQKLKEVYTKLQDLLDDCTKLTDENGTTKCDNTNSEKSEDVQKFLDSMFTKPSVDIYANLIRLRLMARNIVLILETTQSDALDTNSGNYFSNLDAALNVFGNVYRLITCDTQIENSECYVEMQQIHW